MQMPYISQITLNTGDVISLNPDSILVFVGPNNAGKRQAIRDIYDMVLDNPQGVVVTSELIDKPYVDDVSAFMEEYAVLDARHSKYNGYNFEIYDFNYQKYSDCVEAKEPLPDGFREAFFAFLNTGDRLSVCNPAGQIDRTAPAENLIHVLTRDEGYRSKVSNAFREAFDTDVLPHYANGATIPLCLGGDIHSFEAESSFEIYEQLNRYLDQYPKAHLQGDGIKSYLGILLYLYYGQFSTLFIDEPESFLHPPQAFQMGRTLGNSTGKQLFITTHSKELLNGLLQSGSKRLKIIRVERCENTNKFAQIKPDDLNILNTTTFLKYSDAIDSLFHTRTLLCESDSDCKFYEAMLDRVSGSHGVTASTLLLPVGGKSRFKDYLKLLRSLSIEPIVIPDADILNDPGLLKALLPEAGGNWDDIKEEWINLNESLRADCRDVTCVSAKAEIDALFDECKSPVVTSNLRGKITAILATDSAWSTVKNYGKAAFKGDSRHSYEVIEQYLNCRNIYPVPVGELENFIPDISSHGPDWVNVVFETFPDLNDSIYSAAADFVSTWV